MCAADRNTVMVTANVQVAAQFFRFHRKANDVSGPTRNAMAASMAGRRRAANDSPLRSSMCDMESVSLDRSCLASTVPMSGVNGRWRELHNPAAKAQPEATEAIAIRAAAHNNQRDPSLDVSFDSEEETATASNRISGKYAG